MRVAEKSCERKFGGSGVSWKTEVKSIKTFLELLVTPKALLGDNELQQLELGARPKDVDGHSGRCRCSRDAQAACDREAD